jgi:hypothetical protein
MTLVAFTPPNLSRISRSRNKAKYVESRRIDVNAPEADCGNRIEPLCAASSGPCKFCGDQRDKKICQPLFRAQIRPLDRLVSTPEAKHGSSNQRNRSGSVSPIRPRIRLRFGGVNATIPRLLLLCSACARRRAPAESMRMAQFRFTNQGALWYKSYKPLIYTFDKWFEIHACASNP